METTTQPNVKKRMAIAICIVAAILLIPFIAMQFTNEVNWNLFDFILMGALLLTTATGIEIVTRKVKSSKLKIVLTIVILLLLFLAWAELAVGIFDTPFAGN